MTKQPFVLASALALVFGFTVTAQEKAAAPPPEKQQKPAAANVPLGQPSAVVPLKVQIVLSRYQGEKKISALPFTLSVNALNPGAGGGQTTMRMGAQIPIETPSGGPVASYQYKDIGTSIDCHGTILEDGRFRLTLTLEDTSVYGDERGGTQTEIKTASKIPAFRSFRSSQNVVLRDGQSLQYTTATDRISGEVVKVDVTLNIVK